MKILNFSSLSLLFTTIVQTLAGFACPSTSTINTKITENSTMRFSLTEGSSYTRGEVLFCYKGTNNKIEKFYKGNSKIDKFIGTYFFPDSSEIPGSLTCTYKQANNKFFWP